MGRLSDRHCEIVVERKSVEAERVLYRSTLSSMSSSQRRSVGGRLDGVQGHGMTREIWRVPTCYLSVTRILMKLILHHIHCLYHSISKQHNNSAASEPAGPVKRKQLNNQHTIYHTRIGEYGNEA